MHALVLAIGILFSGAAYAAQYTPPPNAPRVMVPSHGVEVGVWAVQTPVGHGIGIFERSGSGDWSLCNWCLAVVEYPTLDSVVAAAGGAGPFVVSKLDAINDILARRYPSVTPEPTGSTLDQVNGALGNYVIRIVNGVPTLGPR